ncbi:MAG TPA: DUF309 domain-containing protein [Terracidiphilus sp.]|nr:DUF309 domain-containing protein [Terracidiphilus sp.]
MKWTAVSHEEREGLRCYEEGCYFEAHEHWETVWLRLREPEKSFLQALIKLTAAMHHLRRGNRIGALSHLRKVLKRLDESPAEFYGVKVDALRGEVAGCIAEIERGTPEADVCAPRIQTLSAQAREQG